MSSKNNRLRLWSKKMDNLFKALAWHRAQKRMLKKNALKRRRKRGLREPGTGSVGTMEG